MTKRLSVSVLENRFHDAQRVDKSDLEVEQNSKNQSVAAVVNNFFGTGVLPESAEQTILFDSDNLDATSAALVSANDFDGTGITASTQPGDNNLGNQIEVELTDSDVFGRLSVKVCIIGLAFDNTLQLDRFYFYRNEKQVSAKHYKRILTILFNDFKGNNNCSIDNGGRVVVREAAPFQLSRDPIMVAQDVEPDLFFRDFKLANILLSLHQTIQLGIGSEYDADNLNINTTGEPVRTIAPADVTTQIGQKFKAATDNIQKITLLLGVIRDTTKAEAAWFDWDGTIVITVYSLQNTVNSPSDIVPDLAIDFDPAPVPLAEISYSQAELEDLGYVLTDVAQPVDFVFSTTKIASPGALTVGNYYAVTFRRSGSSTKGTIFSECGLDLVDNARLTLFSGVWVDVPENDLWFQVWTDAAKVASGQGYDAGNGIQFDKTAVDEDTGATIDYQANHFSFASTGQGTINTGIIQAITKESLTIQDERTGDDVFSRKQYVPQFSFVSPSGLEDLKEISEPLIVGCVVDSNPKLNLTTTQLQSVPGLVRGDTFCIINPDPDLLSMMLVGSKLIPDDSCAQLSYKVYKTTVCTDGYGDVNGDGVIDATDLQRASELIGEGIHLTSTQAKIKDGYISTLELLRADVDGDSIVSANDVDLIESFINKTSNSFPAGTSFTHLCLQVQQMVGRSDGYFSCTYPLVRLDGYQSHTTPVSTLTPAELLYDGYDVPVSIDSVDTVFNTIPFVPVEFKIVPQPFWQAHFLNLSSEARKLPTTFTFATGIDTSLCSVDTTICENPNELAPTSDPGRNDFYVPNNLIIGDGQILRPDGSAYKQDFEIGTVILEIPESPIENKSLNIFDTFVADRGLGKTSSAYNAMRYSDCAFVQPEDLQEGRVRFDVSIMSISKNTDGYDSTDGYGLIINDVPVGIYVDQSTGLLTIWCTDVNYDPIYKNLRTKLQILVYLKKAGFNNTTLTVSGDETNGLLS